MKQNKILIFTLFFAFLGLLFCGLNVSATITTSSEISVQGAQVRTAGTAGIRFVGKIEESYEKTNVTAYGMALAFGEVNADEIEVGGTVNGKEVLCAQVNSLSGSNYYVNLTDIPTSMYGQKITARAYVVDDGNIIYAASATVRSLGEVTLSVKAAGQTSTLIEEIKNTLSSSYKQTYTDANGNIYVGNAVYEVNPSKLEEEFVKDWNTKFGTTWTEITYADLQASAIDGTNPLTTTSDADCSGTNFYTFFKTDATTSGKWQWLLNYLIKVGSSTVHPLRQANAILGDGTCTDTYGSGMNLFYHLSASITNFFNSGSSRDANNDIVFDGTTKYEQIETYNTSVYAINPELVAIGNTIELPSTSLVSGYDFAGYLASETTYNDTYTVTSDSVVLEKQYTATNYTVKYYDGANEITTLASTYTIESDDITLPEYNKDGYAFKGWYTTSSFDAGTEVTEITTGSTGNKEFYAKMEVTSNVAVNATFDLNGGTWDTSYILEHATVLQETTLQSYNTVGSAYTQACLNTTAGWTFWYYIGLNETSISGIYEITEIVSGNANVTAGFDYVIMWCDQITGSQKTILTSIYKNRTTYVGKYVILENIPSASTTSCAITMKVIDASETTKSITKTFVDAEELPIPIKTDDSFIGWKSSVDGSVSTTYPGYTTNPGNITYKAIYASTPSDSVVTFDYNGGKLEIDDMLKYSTILQETILHSYNTVGSVYTQACLNTTAGWTFWYYIALNETKTTGIYEITQIVSGNANVTPGFDYVIMWCDQITTDAKTVLNTMYNNSSTYLGKYVILQNIPSAATTSCSITMSVIDPNEKIESISIGQNELVELPTPLKTGYLFAGWYDAANNLYDSVDDFAGKDSLTVTAKWVYDEHLVGQFEGNSYVVVGNNIQLLATYVSGNPTNGALNWTSETPEIATVSSSGTVTGVSEGIATIVVSDPEYPTINFTFYVTVVNEDPTGLSQLIYDSNNASLFNVEGMVIGDANDAATGGQWGYYSGLIVQSVSKLFYGEEFTIHNDNLKYDSDTYGTFASYGTTVEFITFHYAADTPYATNAAANAGNNLSAYSYNAAELSYHFGVGNDGAWAAQPEEYTAWHAGSGSSLLTWVDSGLTVLSTDPELATTTLGSDGYFYINGRKTNVASPYGTTYKLSEMGFAYKIVGNKYYMPSSSSFRYDSTYARLCTAGGGVNSLGIESSVREGSDLWLTWQYSAQLCAHLLNKYNLPLYKLVGHNFWSGKWCPQPMLENNLEIWHIFVQMVKREMTRLGTYSSASLSLSSASKYIESNGRVNTLPTYSECVTYDVTYTYNGETKTITLSTILPGQLG